MKYRLTEETFQFGVHTLYRIECVTAFADVKVGDKGGWIESEANLSQYGGAWVYGDALVCDNAEVYGDAEVYDNAEVSGNAWVYGNAKVCGHAWVRDNAKVCGHAKVWDNAKVCGYAEVYGNAKVYGHADYIVFKNWWSSGRYFTWTRSNNKWRVGCFYGTGEELIAKAYKDSEVSGREYKRVVDYVNSILQEGKI